MLNLLCAQLKLAASASARSSQGKAAVPLPSKLADAEPLLTHLSGGKRRPNDPAARVGDIEEARAVSPFATR